MCSGPKLLERSPMKSSGTSNISSTPRTWTILSCNLLLNIKVMIDRLVRRFMYRYVMLNCTFCSDKLMVLIIK
nr:unnamed protein product [Callosobruchus chinensis]